MDFMRRSNIDGFRRGRSCVLAAVFVAGGMMGTPVQAQGIEQPLDCLLTPNKLVQVAIAARGIVKEVLVDRGERVKKGQRLASLESGVEIATVNISSARANRQAQLDSAKQQLEFRERQLLKSTELFRKKVLSAFQLDEVQTDRNVAALLVSDLEEEMNIQRLELKRAEETLKTRSLDSPIDGVVVSRLVSAGEYVDADIIFVLASIDPLNVEVVAPSDILGQVRTGMAATISPEAPVGGEYRAQVIVVDPIVDAASGTFGIRLEMPNPQGKISAGLRCSIRFSG